MVLLDDRRFLGFGTLVALGCDLFGAGTLFAGHGIG